MSPQAPVKTLTRRALDELETLQATMRRLVAVRNAALRVLSASRNVTVPSAQREFWLEFAWLDQEYRISVRRLAQFCKEHRDEPDKHTHWSNP